MKGKLFKYILSSLLIVIVIFSLGLYVYIKQKNKINQSQLLNQANCIVSDEIVNDSDSNIIEQDVFSIQEISEDNNIIGKVKIPKIGVEAPIKEGTDSETLKLSVGHFQNTKYWNGNVVLASHNRGSYAHYFENLDQLVVDDEIIYQTKLGTRIYQVSEIEQISETDMSVLNNTEENTITLITCITNKSNLRLCVKAVEKV